MKLKKYFFIICFIVFGILLFQNKVYAGTQKWNRLHYDVTLNENGSMEVIETWDIHVSDTNTLFKDFKLDKTKFSDITNVSVTEVSPSNIEYEQIYEEQFHVSPQCFYAKILDEDPNTFEIAWNVGFDNSSGDKTYSISYKIKDAVKVYNDCTELYWMFLDNSNTISAKKVTGTVKLPKAVDDIEKLRVWGHGQYNANIEKASNDTVKFECNNFLDNTMLEIRIVTEENIYSRVNNKVNTNYLDTILTEEGKWAEEANNYRKKAKSINIVIFLISVVLALFFIVKYLKYAQEGKEIDFKYRRNNSGLKYFREIPNEKNATPSRAAYLYYFMKSNSYISSYIPQLFSATMLDLALKGYIEFERIDEKDFSIIIKNKSVVELEPDERVFFNIILRAAKSDNYITTKQLTNYTKIFYEQLHNELSSIESIVRLYHESENNIDEERKKVNSYWNKKTVIWWIVFFCISCILLPVFFSGGFEYGLIPLLILIFGPVVLAIKCLRNSSRISILSDKGAEECLQWKALKNYMTDFSLLNEKQVPDLGLWEKFLVYATAFGISKQVIKQLKIVYPEINNPDYYRNRDYSYIYFMGDNRFNDNFIHSLDRAMSQAIRSSQNAYDAAHSSSSSGSGGGGGFSGGGGGGRRWWPELVVDN